jgi:RHS repeat-associated protein
VKHTYVTLDGAVFQETWGSNTLIFGYDENGQPFSVTYNGATYYYVLNQQGDVIRIVNSAGATKCSYTYDAWGNVIASTGTASGIGAVNPLLYRGYYYDAELGMYYLQSRYYDPAVKRFVNADSMGNP